MSDKRLTARDKAYANLKKYAKKANEKNTDRLTDRDMEIEERNRKIREDATVDYELGAPPNFDRNMYIQPESLGGDPKNMNMGGLGECKGSKAIRGKGFKGVF